MKHDCREILIGAICRPYGAWLQAGARSTKMPLLTELDCDINDICLFCENRAQYLKQFNHVS